MNLIKYEFKRLKGYQSEWQIVFIIAAVIYCIGGILSTILLNGEIQPWAKINENFQSSSNLDVVKSSKVGFETQSNNPTFDSSEEKAEKKKQNDPDLFHI